MNTDKGYVDAPVPDGLDLKAEIIRLKKKRERSSWPITIRKVKSRT